MQLALEKSQGPFLSRIFSLAGAKRTLYTPLFIPSFSSTVREDWRTLMKATAAGVARGEMVLVSAFDLLDRKTAQVPRGFAALMLDSGGYEARRLRRPWSLASYHKASERAEADVVVAYDGDHQTKLTWRNQLKAQLASLTRVAPGTLRTILLHAEIDPETAVAIAKELARHGDDFDIVGLAEKELALSLVDRIRAVRILRRELDSAGVVRPIHMFGADHPLSLIAYTFAGADLFDGLGWTTEFYLRNDLSARDSSHAPLFPEWLELAKRPGATPVGALYEWNLEALSTLMADARKIALEGDDAAAVALLQRNSTSSRILEALSNGG